MGGIGIIIGIIVGICISGSITCFVIVASNNYGDSKGTRHDFGKITGATYYEQNNRYGDVRFL